VQAVTPLFDLFAILAVVATAATCVRLGYLLIFRRRVQALRSLKHWGVGAAAYIALALAVGAARPERSIGLGSRWCFDDFCVAVDHVTRRDALPNAIYTLDVEAYNAGRLPEGARYPWMFVRDGQGRHYLPDHTGWISEIETRIPGHASRHVAVDFTVPATAQHLAFVTGHGFGKPCSLIASLLMAGDSRCLFQKYDSIRLE
jgi:hypothetical protein